MAPGKGLVLRTVLRNSSLGTLAEVDAVEAPWSNATTSDNSTLGGGDCGGGGGDEDDTGVAVNGTLAGVDDGQGSGSAIFDIPPKEIIIVLAMLGLWIYSIVITRRAWYRILKQ